MTEFDRTRIGLIVALAHDSTIGIIGADGHGRIPWDHPADLRYFRRVTAGGVVIMGRRTWESIPAVGRGDKKEKLPGRHKIVVSKSLRLPPEAADRASVLPSLEEALQVGLAHTGKQIWLIGGASIYEEALRRGWVHNLLCTRVPGDFPLQPGEERVSFPERAIHWGSWALVGSETPSSDSRIRFEAHRPIPGGYRDL